MFVTYRHLFLLCATGFARRTAFVDEVGDNAAPLMKMIESKKGLQETSVLVSAISVERRQI